MNCAKCGKEFGEGAVCQNCGIDRVTGLANYGGYDGHTRSSNPISLEKTEYAANKITACYACGEIIPEGSTFCPYCKKKLLTTCKKCGNTYSTQYSVCNKCGTDRYEYYQEMQAKEKEEKRRKLEEARKKHALEREESKLKSEVSELRKELEGHGNALATWWFFWMILLVLGLSLIEEIQNGVILVSIMGVGLFVAIIGNCIIIDLPKRKIEKWKQEHPNDPRCKYL